MFCLTGRRVPLCKGIRVREVVARLKILTTSFSWKTVDIYGLKGLANLRIKVEDATLKSVLDSQEFQPWLHLYEQEER